jgi:hypothetical protein
VWVDFSPDPGQKYMYVTNQDNEQIDILDRASGQVRSIACIRRTSSTRNRRA